VVTAGDEWIPWDYALAHAFQTVEDLTDDNGILVWEKEDEAVEIDAVRKIDKFRAALDRATAGTKNKPYKPQPGEYFVPKVWSRRSDGSIQSYSEWVRKDLEEG